MYERRGGSVFGSFVLGVLFGAVLGLLFAPRKGEETREMLAEKANEYWGQAGELCSTGAGHVTVAVDTGTSTAGEKSEQLRAKIDEARARLQEQVAKSTEIAKEKLSDVAPAVKDAVDKAAEGTKTGVDFAKDKASQGLDFVAKKVSGAEEETAPAENVAEGSAATEPPAEGPATTAFGDVPEV